VTDAAVLAPQTDGVLVVTESGRSREGAVRRSLEILGQVGAKVLGLTLNRVTPRGSGYSYYYYYYTDSQGRRKKRKKRGKQAAPPPAPSPEREQSRRERRERREQAANPGAQGGVPSG
jgi:Mrp family chromosome partitioning ATPase